MKSHLIIINAGKFGREVFTWANQAIAHGAPWTIRGFLDDRADVLRGFSKYPPVLSSVENYLPGPSDVFLCALGDPKSKQEYCQKILSKGGRFTTLIHPTALVGPSVQIGPGSIIGPFTQLSCDIEFGKFVTFGTFSSAAHDVAVGDWCQISGHCSLNGGAVLEEAVFLGATVTILPEARVGAWAYVGAGSVVLRRVKANTKVYGNPALEIGTSR